MSTKLIDAIRNKTIHNLEELITTSDVGFVVSNGNTALIYACNKKMPEVALALINTGMSKPEQVNKNGKTALMYACSNEMPNVALALINTGMSKPEQVNNDGNTALLYACNKKMPEVAMALINTGLSKPEHSNKNGDTALMYACGNEMPDVALVLINTDMSKPEQVNNHGETALTYACSNEMPEVALALINTGMSKPEIVNSNGFTALMITCIEIMPEIALALINTGMSKPEHVNNDGETALMIACFQGLSDVALALINTGISKPEAVDNENKSALDYAEENNMTEVVELLKKQQTQEETQQQIFNTNQSCLDIIMYEEVPIIEYLKEENRVVFVFYDTNITQTTRIGLEVEHLTKAMNEKEHYIIYECKVPDTIRPENIINKQYFDIKKLCGFGDLVEMTTITNIMNIIRQKTANIFVFKRSEKELATTISDDVLNHRTSYVSARHCQSGQSAYVYKLDKNVVFKYENTQSKGGNTVKRTKKRQYKKSRTIKKSRRKEKPNITSKRRLNK